MISFTSTTNNTNEYFKVRWTQVLDLVRNRKVFLNDGFAYVMQTDVISGICQTFRSELSQELIVSITIQFTFLILISIINLKFVLEMFSKIQYNI